MTLNGVLQIALFAVLVTALVKPLGGYMTKFFKGERVFLSPIVAPVERLFLRAAGIKPDAEQNWIGYGLSMLVFTFLGTVVMYAVMRLQGMLPLNPAGLGAVAPDLALNTAISFATNTNWQAYVPESTMSYLTQMIVLTVHNFLSAAAGIALAMVLIRGFARKSAKTIGNFWVDVTRCTLYLLLPVSFVIAVFLVWQGVPQNLDPYTQATTLEGATQVIAQGPVASQEAIKMFGTNGGGFFNANSAHPFENPTALSNLIEMISILAVAAALTNVFGRMVGNQRQGWVLFAAMAALFLCGVATVYVGEAGGNPGFAALHVDQTANDMQAGGNMEGKEVRFGIANSALFTTITTDASCGAINTQHDALLPLSGMVALINIELGELIFGGVGSGLYGMLLFAVITVFIAGLMVGRTPEYLGKKIEAREVKLSMLAILALALSILGFTAIATVAPAGLAGIANNGPHGFTEILYAYSSATGNNGSAFAGLSANTKFYNVTLAIAMFLGRFFFIVPVLGIAGSLAAKKVVPPTSGTFPTTGPLFIGLLLGVIVIVGGLTFFPALALGPIVEHLAMLAGTQF
jgi:K+-transporting ATPase ATPase A chain